MIFSIISRSILGGENNVRPVALPTHRFSAAMSLVKVGSLFEGELLNYQSIIAGGDLN